MLNFWEAEVAFKASPNTSKPGPRRQSGWTSRKGDFVVYIDLD